MMLDEGDLICVCCVFDDDPLNTTGLRHLEYMHCLRHIKWHYTMRHIVHMFLPGLSVRTNDTEKQYAGHQGYKRESSSQTFFHFVILTG